MSVRDELGNIPETRLVGSKSRLCTATLDEGDGSSGLCTKEKPHPDDGHHILTFSWRSIVPLAASLAPDTISGGLPPAVPDSGRRDDALGVEVQKRESSSFLLKR